MDRIMRTNANSLHLLEEIGKGSSSTTHANYENNQSPDIAIMKATIDSNKINVASSIRNNKDQKIVNETDYFLDNQDMKLQETSNEIFNSDKRNHHFTQEQSRNNEPKTHFFGTQLQNTKKAE